MARKNRREESADDKQMPITKGGKLSESEIAPFWLSAIIESADDGIISKTLDSIITSWNKGAERIFGYTEEEMVGKSVTLLIPPDHHDEEPVILDRIRRGERIGHYETVRIKKNGQLIDVSLTVSPIRGADGRIIGASKIVRDISDRKRAEAQLKTALMEAEQAKAEAEEANRLKDEFLTTVSHELRTPLTSMMGWSRMLRAGMLDEESSKKALEIIDRNVRSQAQLIEDLLDISRITSGKMRLELEPLQPWAVVNASIDSVKPAAEAKNIRIQIVMDSNVGLIYGDYQRLQQVIWNLLSNAVKFTPPDGAIRVELAQVASNIEIIVSDNGRGIKPEFLPQIFDRFTQADSSMTRSYGGMGIGLAIVKSIVEYHGGSVSAKSEGEGKGATFTVSIPLLPERNKGEYRSEFSRDELLPVNGGGCPAGLEGLKLLLVDDEPDTCEMITTAFRQCGTNVKFVTSAAEALRCVEDWAPDILIADISMPEMDGYELIRRIRKREARLGGNIPAIALTAMARIEDRVKALASGFQMHVAKPVELDELRSITASLANLVVKEG